MTSFSLCSFLLSAFALAGTMGQEAESTPVTVDKLTIAQLIDDTVIFAGKGVEASALKTSLESIQQLADSYLNERNVTVDGQDIVDVLEEITEKKKWQLTLSALLEDPLVQEERKVKAGLFVLNGLSLRIRAEDNEKQENILVAAVSFTSKSVGRSVSVGESLYRYNERNTQVRRRVYLGFPRRYPPGFYNKKGLNVHSRDMRRDWGFSGSASGSVSGSFSGNRGSASASASGSVSGGVSYSSTNGFSGSFSGSATGSASAGSSGSHSSSGSSSGGSSSKASSSSSGGGFSGSAAGSASGRISG